MISYKKLFQVIGLFCLLPALPAWAKIPEKPEGRVSDFAEMLTEDEEAPLQSLAERLEKANGAQLAVVTVPSLEGLDIEDYAERLFKKWGIGRKGKDDGVLILVSLNELKARIEVGYGLEGALNDAKAGRILDEAVMPQMRVRNFGEGLQAGADRIVTAIVGEAGLPAELPVSEEAMPGWLKFALPIGIGLFMAAGFVAFGAGFRGDWKLVAWGAIFGGIPLGFGLLISTAMGYPKYLFPVWASLMFLIGILFCRRFLARYGGPWRVKVSVGFGGGRRSGGSKPVGGSGAFGGGASGGGGADR